MSSRTLNDQGCLEIKTGQKSHVHDSLYETRSRVGTEVIPVWPTIYLLPGWKRHTTNLYSSPNKYDIDHMLV